MSDKGFTLIELLGVIAILAILILISVPLVTQIVNNAHKFSDESILKQAEDSAINYGMENAKLLADNPKSTFITNRCALDYIVDSNNPFQLKTDCKKVVVSIQTLINEGYLKDDASKLKKDGQVIIYKYKGNKKTTGECLSSEIDSCYNFELKAYAAKSLLN